MPYFYLIASLGLSTLISIFGGFYNRKNADKANPAPVYNLVYCLSCLVCWVILFATDFSFDARVLLYSCGFGLCYTFCQIGFIGALRTGPLSLTNLLLQLSLIGTTIWGFFFWNTEFTPLVGAGLVLVVLSLWLSLYTKSEKGDEEKGARVSLKWLFYSLLAFTGNAGCSIIQRTQQMQFNGEYGNQLMAFALAFAVAFALVIYIRSDKTQNRAILKSSAIFPLLSGVANFVLNLFVILLASTSISPGVIYPVIAVGGMALISIFSLVIFREKLRFTQWIGIGVGAIAVLLLSI